MITKHRFTRLAFFLYGPAQIGSLMDPVPAPRAIPCDRCGRPMASHTVVRGLDHPPYFTCPTD
jgi:hypothetical protein